MTSATVVSSAIAVALAVSVAPSHAQPSPNSAAATAQFDQGRALMKDKKYAEACAAFERSQKLEPAPGTLYNLAVCYEKLGKLATAWAAYRDLGARDPNKQRRKAAADAATALAKRIPKLVIQLDPSPKDGWVVTLDGTDVTNLVGVETPVDLGEHVVTAKAANRKAVTKKVDAREGKKLVITLTLPDGDGDAIDPQPDPGADGQRGDARPITGPIDQPGPSSRRRNGYLLLGTGALAVAGGVVFGTLAQGKWDEAKALCGDDLQCSSAAQLEQGNELVSAARLRANVSTGLVISGAVLAGVGAYFIISAPKARAERRKAVRVTPSLGPVAGVLVEGRF